MKLIYLVTLFVLHICSGFGDNERCEQVKDHSGIISDTVEFKRYFMNDRGIVFYNKCWIIAVPESSSIQLKLEHKNMTANRNCYDAYILVKLLGTKEEHVFCPNDRTGRIMKAKRNVSIQFFIRFNEHSSFRMPYEIESLICKLKEHFRCSDYFCIPRNKTCDGVKDCENGDDEMGCGSQICNLKEHFRCSDDSCVHENQVCNGEEDCENGADEIGCETPVKVDNEATIKRARLSRENAIGWLKEKRSESSGWDVNTHRAVTALYLSSGANFEEGNSEDELMAKELELQTAVALLRNSSSILPINELSMFINALTVSCHNPRQFYGYDLVKILRERVLISKSSTPGAYLTLCIANWEFSESVIRHVLNILNMHSGYPFQRDIQAMTVMALTCIKNKTNSFNKITNATEMYNTTIKNIIASQEPNGNFGNVHTTALVAQALLSSGQEYNKSWNFIATMNYLMMKLKSSPDFLTTTLTLPVLNSKSLVDIRYVNCSKPRKHGKAEINDVINKLGGKMQIKYSLFIGDEMDVIHSIILRMPESCSAYDLMRVAEAADSKYTFLHTDVSGHMYVHDIAGITNDPEAGKFWLLYIGSTGVNETIIHANISPDKLILNNNEHFIMWYKTVHTED